MQQSLRGQYLPLVLSCTAFACSGSTTEPGGLGSSWSSSGTSTSSGSSSGSAGSGSSGSASTSGSSSSGGSASGSDSGSSAGGSDGGATGSDSGSSDGSSNGAGKKGVGLGGASGFGGAQLQALEVAWYYDWGAGSGLQTQVEFVPMIFSLNALNQQVIGPIVLGFNEPDLATQGNITVANALSAWPQVVAKAPFVVAPAVAGNPVTGTWFPAFMQAKPKVDAVGLHWYKGADAATFISDAKALIAAYQKPVWVTEFAPQTIAESKTNPAQFSQQQVDQFIASTVAWMNTEPMVARYAWHDSRMGTSALFTASGALTATGTTYAAAH